jgi:beta-galactosidase GanA
MKQAGFNVVRMGDLSWDSFEPSQGKFDFEWFDKIMDKMQASGIRVIVDIPGLPARRVWRLDDQRGSESPDLVQRVHRRRWG